MNSNRTQTKGYLLQGTAALAILVALMGCDSGQDRNDIAQTPSPVAATESTVSDPDQNRDDIAQPPAPVAADEGVAGDTSPDIGATNSTQTAEQEQGIAGVSDEPAANENPMQIESAVAQIQPTSAGNAEGTVTFMAGENNQEMRVSVELSGLEPGLHGFHIHEVGDCSADDASSAGGHFNPNDASHGSPDGTEQHVGDMGNIEADEDGRVSTELSFPGLAFVGPASILDKSVVIHSDEDDLESQPAGDAGERVGCGVIQSDQ